MGKFGNTSKVIDAEKEQKLKNLEIQLVNTTALVLEKREEMIKHINTCYEIKFAIYKLKRGIE